MPRERCDDDEQVVRAICSPYDYDPDKKRINSSLFRTSNISLSRLSILDLPKIIEIFRRDFEKPDSSKKLELCGEINVKDLRNIAKTNEIDLWVEIDELPENPAHAVIPLKITSRSLATKIIKALVLHDV
jgi:hypothetical protein